MRWEIVIEVWSSKWFCSFYGSVVQRYRRKEATSMHFPGYLPTSWALTFVFDHKRHSARLVHTRGLSRPRQRARQRTHQSTASTDCPY